MTTLLGKILLFLNLALSMGFAFWALSLYTNRINWTDTKIGEGTGQYAVQAETIKRLQEAEGRAATRWETARRQVGQEEERLPLLQKWCADQLQILRKGGGPIQAVVKLKGQTQLDKDNLLPQLGPVIDSGNRPIAGLDNIAAQNSRYLELQQQLTQTTDALNAALAREAELTKQVGDGKDKGLLSQLAAEQLAEKRSVDEQEYLKPLLYNRQVEAHLLAKRQRALEARLKELQATHVAKQP